MRGIHFFLVPQNPRVLLALRSTRLEHGTSQYLNQMLDWRIQIGQSTIQASTQPGLKSEDEIRKKSALLPFKMPEGICRAVLKMGDLIGEWVGS